MGAYLVGAPGDEFHPQEGQPPADRHRLVAGLNGHRVRRRAVYHRDLALCRVLLQPARQCGRRRLRPPEGDAEILLFQPSCPDKLSQVGQRLSGLGHQHKAAGAGVQPVAQRRGKALAGAVFALFIEIQLHPVDEGVRVVFVVHRQAGGFVGNEQLVIFIHHFCGILRPQESRAFRGRRSVQLVGQKKQLYLVARLHTGGEGLLFAVQLYLVFPQGLVQAARRQHRVLLHQVFVQPGGQKAVYAQHFHVIESPDPFRPEGGRPLCPTSPSASPRRCRPHPEWGSAVPRRG